MRKRNVMLIIILLTGFLSGIMIAQGFKAIEHHASRPILPDTSSSRMATVNAETPIVMETRYLRCGHRVIGEFTSRDEILGKSIKELNGDYSSKHGYLISTSEDGALIISQKIDALCPQCSQKRHLGLKDNRVVVYKGPAGYDREILRVTSIDFSRLPDTVKNDILSGKMEFESEEDLNYCLESLDEYER